MVWLFASLLLIVAVNASPIELNGTDFELMCEQERSQTSCECSEDTNLSNQPFIQFISNSKSLTLHSCLNLRLSLNLERLNLTKLTVKNVTNLTIDGIYTSPDTNVNVQLSNVAGELAIQGDVVCNDCNQDIEGKVYLVSKKENAGNGSEMPQIRIKVKEAANVTFQRFSSGFQQHLVDVRIQIADSSMLKFQDVFFNHLPASGLEVFNTDDVRIEHCEFHNSSVGSLVVNGGCPNVTIKDSLMDKSTVMLLDPKQTDVRFQCTTSPNSLYFQITSELDAMLQEDPDCLSTLNKWTADATVECTGAIALALTSAVILICVLAFLFWLQKTGRLDDYL